MQVVERRLEPAAEEVLYAARGQEARSRPAKAGIQEGRSRGVKGVPVIARLQQAGLEQAAEESREAVTEGETAPAGLCCAGITSLSVTCVIHFGGASVCHTETLIHSELPQQSPTHTALSCRHPAVE